MDETSPYERQFHNEFVEYHGVGVPIFKCERDSMLTWPSNDESSLDTNNMNLVRFVHVFKCKRNAIFFRS